MSIKIKTLDRDWRFEANFDQRDELDSETKKTQMKIWIEVSEFGLKPGRVMIKNRTLDQDWRFEANFEQRCELDS